MWTYEAKSNAVDGLFVCYDHIEAEFVVHDGSQTHNTNMNIISGITHFQLGRMSHPFVHSGTVKITFITFLRAHRTENHRRFFTGSKKIEEKLNIKIEKIKKKSF